MTYQAYTLCLRLTVHLTELKCFWFDPKSLPLGARLIAGSISINYSKIFHHETHTHIELNPVTLHLSVKDFQRHLIKSSTLPKEYYDEEDKTFLGMKNSNSV